MSEIQTIPQCDAALYRLLQATLTSERLTATRDSEIAAIQKKYQSNLQKADAQIAALESGIQAFYVAHRDELEQDGKKSLQLSNGLLGMRAPTNPGLIPLNDNWSWEKIAQRVKELFKLKYFHPPKPPNLDKVKLKKELSADQLKRCGLKLDDSEKFYLELNRLAAAEAAAAGEAA
jgi:Bacteriophage Mu Gam like protein